MISGETRSTGLDHSSAEAGGNVSDPQEAHRTPSDNNDNNEFNEKSALGCPHPATLRGTPAASLTNSELWDLPARRSERGRCSPGSGIMS